jgi:outer membrane receptor protein involved in Fe transport
VPPLHGSLSLAYDSSSRWKYLSTSELTLWWADDQDRLSPADESDPRIDPDGTDGWTSVDLDFSGPIGERKVGASWNFGVHNLFDEAYRIHGSGLDAPGLYFVGGIKIWL